MKEDDTYSPQFFRDRMGYQGIKYIKDGNKNYEIEIFNSNINHQLKLKSFIISLILRYDLYLLSNNKPTNLGKYFDTLRNEYINKIISLTKYPMTVIKFKGFSEGVFRTPFRNRIKGINAICISLKCYYFTIYFDKRPTPESQNIFLVKQDKFDIYTFENEGIDPIKIFAIKAINKNI